jgi:hypothetical protein
VKTTNTGCLAIEDYNTWTISASVTLIERGMDASAPRLSRSGFLRCVSLGGIALVQLVLIRCGWPLSCGTSLAATATYTFPVRPRRAA